MHQKLPADRSPDQHQGHDVAYHTAYNDVHYRCTDALCVQLHETEVTVECDHLTIGVCVCVISELLVLRLLSVSY